MPTKKIEKQPILSSGEEKLFQKFFDADRKRDIEKKKLGFALVATVIASVVLYFVLTLFFILTINYIRDTYVAHEREMIIARELVRSANDWERLPEGQRREELLNRYMEIIKYYNVYIPEDQRMNHKTIINSFDVLYDCTKITKVDIFLPIAYMKAMTNFNPNYEQKNRYGIGAFYVKEGENVSNLPIVKDKANFSVSYKGIPTLKNPIESVKLLVAKINDLNKIFNNRSDWVILALLTSEYEVIDKYWFDGKGQIPEDRLKSGNLKEVREYYYIFRNWKVIPIDNVPFPIPIETPIESGKPE